MAFSSCSDLHRSLTSLLFFISFKVTLTENLQTQNFTSDCNKSADTEDTFHKTNIKLNLLTENFTTSAITLSTVSEPLL